MMMKKQLAEIILPLAVKGTFTYIIPTEHVGTVNPGSRVIVQFGNRKLYSGIVFSIHEGNGNEGKLKAILEILDKHPLVSEIQLRLWSWISEYYLCTIGEVMKAALPSGFCPESEMLLRANPEFNRLVPPMPGGGAMPLGGSPFGALP